MFAVCASRTMAGAKPKKFKEPEIVRTMAQVRAEKMAELRRHEIEAARAKRAAMDEAIRAAKERWRPPLFTVIEARICRALKVTRVELRSSRRQRELSFARQALAYWACRMTGLSLPEIGRRMGGKDHTTILHGKNVYPAKRLKMGRHLRPVR